MMRKNGFTLIEALIGTAVFLVVAFGIYEAYRALYISMSASYTKTAATNLLAGRFEALRSMSYASVTSTNETALVNGLSFDIITTVLDQDDPFDGLAPSDTTPADYKLVEVRVACASCRNFTPITATSRLAP